MDKGRSIPSSYLTLSSIYVLLQKGVPAAAHTRPIYLIIIRFSIIIFDARKTLYCNKRLGKYNYVVLEYMTTYTIRTFHPCLVKQVVRMNSMVCDIHKFKMFLGSFSDKLDPIAQKKSEHQSSEKKKVDRRPDTTQMLNNQEKPPEQLPY